MGKKEELTQKEMNEIEFKKIFKETLLEESKALAASILQMSVGSVLVRMRTLPIELQLKEIRALIDTHYKKQIKLAQQMLNDLDIESVKREIVEKVL